MRVSLNKEGLFLTLIVRELLAWQVDLFRVLKMQNDIEKIKEMIAQDSYHPTEL